MRSTAYTSYTASLDKTTVVLTVLIILVLLLPLVLLVASLLQEPHPFSEIGTHLLVALLMLGIIIFTYGYRITGYRLSSTELTICRPFGKVHIPLSDIRQVRRLEKGDLGWVIRTFGVGGLFGYYGKFYSSKLGHLTYYSTRNDHKLLLRLHDGQQVLLSPDNLNLERELQRKINQ